MIISVHFWNIPRHVSRITHSQLLFSCLRYMKVSTKTLCFRTVRPPRSFVRPFVRTDIVTKISNERLEQF